MEGDVTTILIFVAIPSNHKSRGKPYCPARRAGAEHALADYVRTNAE